MAVVLEVQGMRERNKAYVAVAAVLLLALPAAALAAGAITWTDPTEGVDRAFGDQHLETVVALVELHEVRSGEYPATLDDLRYTGEWDAAALQSVEYAPNADRSAYHVEVERGWAGEPELEVPEGFWRGTGYSEELDPDR